LSFVSFDDTHQSRGAKPSVQWDAPLGQEIGDPLCSAHLLKAKLGVRVQVATNGTQLSGLGQDGIDQLHGGLQRCRSLDDLQTNKLNFIVKKEVDS
jgi:hypothetical protein